MRVLVCEYFSGGGAAGVSDALLAEGREMRDAVVADFRRLGEHEVATADVAEFQQRLRWADAALVIAPETGGVLEQLSAQVEASGRLLLGCASGAVRVAADKRETGQLLAAGGVLTPPFATCTYPAVVKPVDGCGSVGVRLVRGPGQRHPDEIEQPYIPGLAASVSVLAAPDGTIVVLSVNRQAIELVDGEFHEQGYPVPLTAHPLADQARSAAVTACRLIPGLRGFVGVDLVLTDTAAWVIEVNPRITSAYMAVREVCPFNMMGAIL